MLRDCGVKFFRIDNSSTRAVRGFLGNHTVEQIDVIQSTVFVVVRLFQHFSVHPHYCFNEQTVVAEDNCNGARGPAPIHLTRHNDLPFTRRGLYRFAINISSTKNLQRFRTSNGALFNPFPCMIRKENFSGILRAFTNDVFRVRRVKALPIDRSFERSWVRHDFLTECLKIRHRGTIFKWPVK